MDLYINDIKYVLKDNENFKEIAEKQKRDYYRKKLESFCCQIIYYF